MSVYTRADGIYVFDFQIRGVRFYGSTGCTTRREAEAIEDQRRDEARDELKRRSEARNAPLTVNAALDRFWIEVGQHYGGSYGKTVFTALKWMLKEFGANTLVYSDDPNVESLTSSRIAEAIARRRADQVLHSKGKPVTNATVNRTLTELLRRILLRARNVWDRPVHKVTWKDLMLSEPKERTRELRDHEDLKLTQSMRSDYLPALRFFLASGCRLKEVVTMRKDDFDWTVRTITIRGKGDKVDVIPLTNEIAAIVRPLWDHHPEFVFTYVSRRVQRHPKSGKLILKGNRFPITYAGMKSTWRRYGGKQAGLEDFRLHDTRHTRATTLLRTSGNLKLVQQLLRHEDITTTAKYAHANIEDLRAALERDAESRKKSRSGDVITGGKQATSD